MTIREDPEGNEPRALFDFVDIDGKKVLEVGSGDGRLTWRFADRAAHVTGIEPFEPSVVKAKQNLPEELKARVEFHPASFEDFAAATAPGVFDVAILSWSL